MKSFSVLIAFLSLMATGRASDLSIFEFPDGIYAMTALGNRIHRLEMPGGQVLATEAMGRMARVDMSEGVNILAAIRQGIAGRQVHLDMGKIEQVELGRTLAIVTAERGTSIYFPGSDRLSGALLSEGYPQGLMVYRDIAALRWGDQVALYGYIQDRMIQFVFPGEGLRTIHLGESSVVTTWEGKGTFLHSLTTQGFHTIFLSEGTPGNLSAREGKSLWMPIQGHAVGTPWERPIALEDLPQTTEAAAFSAP
jgi:hypothetical protein